MSFRLFRLIAGLALLAASLDVAPANAQSNIELSSVQIELWPEFDRPSMLVIIDGVLSPETPLPATLTLNVPAAASAPHAVAMKDASGQLLTAASTTAPSGDFLAVTLTTDYPNFRVEYYDPTLTFDASAREYAFQWAPDYPVGQVTVRAQQPVGASGMTFAPSLAEIGPADYGLTYYSSALGALKAGQSLTLKLNYTKADSRLSAEVIGADEPAPASVPAQEAQPTPASSNTLTLMVGLAGAALLLGGGLSFWLTRRAETPPGRSKSKTQARKHRSRHSAARLAPPLPRPGSAINANAPAQFCTQCGHGLVAGDQFCRNCGTKIRQ